MVIQVPDASKTPSISQAALPNNQIVLSSNDPLWHLATESRPDIGTMQAEYSEEVEDIFKQNSPDELI